MLFLLIIALAVFLLALYDRVARAAPQIVEFKVLLYLLCTPPILAYWAAIAFCIFTLWLLLTRQQLP